MKKTLAAIITATSIGCSSTQEIKPTVYIEPVKEAPQDLYKRDIPKKNPYQSKTRFIIKELKEIKKSAYKEFGDYYKESDIILEMEKYGYDVGFSFNDKLRCPNKYEGKGIVINLTKIMNKVETRMSIVDLPPFGSSDYYYVFRDGEVKHHQKPYVSLNGGEDLYKSIVNIVYSEFKRISSKMKKNKEKERYWKAYGFRKYFGLRKKISKENKKNLDLAIDKIIEKLDFKNNIELIPKDKKEIRWCI